MKACGHVCKRGPAFIRRNMITAVSAKFAKQWTRASNTALVFLSQYHLYLFIVK